MAKEKDVKTYKVIKCFVQICPFSITAKDEKGAYELSQKVSLSQCPKIDQETVFTKVIGELKENK